MKNIILASVAALSLGLAGTASATEIGPKVSTETNVAQAGCYYQYFYVTNGYQYRYAYRGVCY